MTGQQIARNNLQYVDEVFYFPFDLGLHRQPDARPGEAAAVHHDGDRDLAEPAARLPARAASGRCSSTAGFRRARIRATGWRARSSAACCATSIASACRATSRRGASSTSAPSRERVVVTGSLKFDSLDIPGASPPADRGRNRVLRYFRIAAGRPVIIAASTLKGEEEPVLEAFQRIRAHDAQRAAHHRAAQARTLRRGGAAGPPRPAGTSRGARELRVDAEPRSDVVILDTIGELAQVYQVATVVFVGGSIVDAGGHNILEPAVFGKPIVFGPYMQNFAEIARDVPGATGRRSRCARRGSSNRRCSNCSATRCGAPRSVPAARALVEANRGARGQDAWRRSRSCCRRDNPADVRPFRFRRL